jgi:hypothetical protein
MLRSYIRTVKLRRGIINRQIILDSPWWLKGGDPKFPGSPFSLQVLLYFHPVRIFSP